jgi:hypothetical protein
MVARAGRCPRNGALRMTPVQQRRCPVCQSEDTEGFLRRERVPVHQNLLFHDPVSAVSTTRGDLFLRFCKDCGFVFNGAFDLRRMSYGADYDNSQTCSPIFREHVNHLVQRLASRKTGSTYRIVEVGCGRGDFLKQLVLASGSGSTGVGFDPSYNGPPDDLDGALHFESSFYGPQQASLPADLVVCRNVIEHVPDPIGLLRSIRMAIANSPEGRVVVETPCVEWILEHRVLWDLFYEHCSLFSAESLITAFESSGFRVDKIQRIFGGQYLSAEAVLGTLTKRARRPNRVPQLARSYARVERQQRASIEQAAAWLANRGRVGLWGTAANSVTLANLIDPQRTMFQCVVDLNPNKDGCYIAGTGHPIVSYSSLAQLRIATIVLMNPKYREENEELLRNAGIDLSLVEFSQQPIVAS